MSQTVATDPAVLPDDEVRLTDGQLCEWVDGLPKERNMSMESSEAAAGFIVAIGGWLRSNPIARIFGADAQYRCIPDKPRQVRMPDVSVVLKSRMPKIEERVSTIPPDLAIEVVSPNDMADEIQARLDDLRQAGTPLVWIVYLRKPRLYAHSAAGVREFGLDDIVDAEPVLPGFKAKLRELLGM